MKEQNEEQMRTQLTDIQGSKERTLAKPSKPIPSDTYQIRIVDSNTAPLDFAIGKIESRKLYTSMEQSIQGFDLRYLEVYLNEKRVCIIPYFFTNFDLSTMIENSIAKSLLKSFKLPINIIGNPCLPFAGIEGFFNDKIAAEVAKHLLKKNALMAMKGVEMNSKLSGFAHARSLPTTRLAVNKDTFHRLRKNRSISRKLKDSEDIQFIEVRNPSTTELVKIYELYEATYEKAPVKFGKLDFSYFEKSCQNCIFSVAILNGKWVGFTQLLHRNNEMIAHFAGLDYSVDRKHGLYFALYFEIIRIAQRLGVRTIDFGETTYEWKKRIGCELLETSIYYKHRNPIVNWVLEKLKFMFEPGANELK